jgi:CheY-like chemotaxis protein
MSKVKGRILFYNHNDGKGLVITENKMKYNFSIEDWGDFDHTPEIKQLVEFDIKDDKIIDITVIVQEEVKNNSQEEEHVEVKTEPKVQDSVSSPANVNEAPKVDQKPNFKKDEFQNQELKRDITQIRLQVDVKTAIDKYFHKYKADMAAKYKPDEKTKLLDYFKMKRFLNTAFNHLMERDPDFGDDRLFILKQELEESGDELKKFKDQASHPKLRFENIFLSQQDDFVELKKQMEGNKRSIDVYKNSSNSLASSLRRKEESLYSMDKKSNEYRRVEYDVKALRRKYFDALDSMDKFKKLNENLMIIRDDFAKKYYKEFLGYFTVITEELDEQLTYLVFSKAYEFDTHMWMKARTSAAIRQFFIESQINGTFSSKTFLKYFLNSLDSSKLSHGNKDLMKLLHYLESIEEKSILIINENSDSRGTLRYLASGINKEYKITAVNSPVEFYNVVHNVNPDLVFIDTNIRQFTISEFVQEVQSKTPKDVTIVITSSKFSKKSLDEAKKIGVRHTLDLHLTESEIMKKLTAIVDENYRS